MNYPLPSNQRPLFLIGFMGCGKSTVGPALAQRLGWPFTDLDAVIEHEQGRRIRDIFSEEGESAFRRYEQTALQALLATNDPPAGVIALGGGTFAQPANRALLRQTGGCTIWLHCPLEEIERRCQKTDDRPLFQNRQQLQQLYQQRLSSYQQTNYRVDASGQNPSIVVEEILQCLSDKNND